MSTLIEPGPSPRRLPPEADAVFEGGGVKGIAFAGAIAAAEAHGVREWKNVAGTSAGAIAASLLAAGYDAKGLREILSVDYRRFADYGLGGMPRGLLNSLGMRGLAPGRHFERWLRGHLARSPRARELGTDALTFGDLERGEDEFDDEVPAPLRERARYRLRVIASDVTAGRMLVLPQDIAGFSLTKGGPLLEPDTLEVVTAVRMSMSFPFLYTPVGLWRDGREHLVVDGGLLSNFPVWLFDSGDRPPRHPTWGFRLHPGTTDTPTPPWRKLRSPPVWRFALAKAIFQAATEAWDRSHAERTQAVRTAEIPTGDIRTTDFRLTPEQADWLRRSGEEAATRFFARDDVAEYLDRFAGATATPGA